MGTARSQLPAPLGKAGRRHCSPVVAIVSQHFPNLRPLLTRT